MTCDTSLVGLEEPLTDKIIKNGLNVFEIRKNCYKMVCYTLYLG